MNILFICGLLEVVGIYLACMPIANYIRDRRCYNEYSKNLDVLIEEMRQEGCTVQEDRERLIMAMEGQIKFSKIRATLGLIGIVIMGIFLINTLLRMINL